MNTKRIVFWSIFVIVLALIVWGLIVALNKPAAGSLPDLGTPAPVSTTTDHIEGSADAPVTLIEYGDFQCPACGDYAPIIGQLFAAEGSTTLRVVFRNFPLPQHQNALISAQAAGAAGNQGKFWDMYRLLYAGQLAWQDQSDADARTTFDGYATTLGLNMAQFDADIDSAAVKTKIQDDQAEGQTLAISYTPTFFVNGKVIENPQGYDAFKAAIDAAAH